jgi:hypothetical protein
MTNLIERPSVGRKVVSKGALLFANVGTQIRLNGLSVLPPNFELSFDNFRSVRNCRLIWRRDDFIGIAFENGSHRTGAT